LTIPTEKLPKGCRLAPVPTSATGENIVRGATAVLVLSRRQGDDCVRSIVLYRITFTATVAVDASESVTRVASP
jgi:hypothetical protein